MEDTRLVKVAGSDPEVFMFVTMRDPAPKGFIMQTGKEMTEEKTRVTLRNGGLGESEIDAEIRKARENPI